MLFALGAIGGIAIAIPATRALQQLPLPDEISLDFAPDYRVFGFALLVSLLTGVVFGLAPALQAARTDIAKRIRDESPAGGSRRSRAGNVLVVGQLALSLLLLVAAGLFLRALQRGNRIDPGFDAAGVSIATLNAESWGYDTLKGHAFFAALRLRLEGTSGVSAVSFTDVAPLTASSSGGRIHVDEPGSMSAPDAPGSGIPVRVNYVDADFFTTLRIPLVRGEPIERRNDERSAKVAVINQTLAAKLVPDGNAVGRTFTYGGEKITVIGVARDAKYAWLTEDRTSFVYLPIAQHWLPKQLLIVRGGVLSSQLANAIQRTVQSIDRGAAHADRDDASRGEQHRPPATARRRDGDGRARPHRTRDGDGRTLRDNLVLREPARARDRDPGCARRTAVRRARDGRARGNAARRAWCGDRPRARRGRDKAHDRIPLQREPARLDDVCSDVAAVPGRRLRVELSAGAQGGGIGSDGGASHGLRPARPARRTR
jgi:hypothetical protein